MDENTLLKKSLTTFDRNYESGITLYDDMSYSRNVGFCEYTPRIVASGNIIKTHQYQIGKPQIIQVSDEELEIPTYRLKPESVSHHNTKDESGDTGNDSSVDQLVADDTTE